MEKKFSKTIDLSDTVLPPLWKFMDKVKQPVNEKVEGVYSSGNERLIAKRICLLLAQAKESIALCSFLLADDEVERCILQAAKRGVRVYLLLASENRLEHDAEDEFSHNCQTQHKEMLKNLGGLVFIRSAAHFHGKFVLIDFNLPSASGLLLTANITKEAIERNEEIGVLLSPKESKQLADIFRFVFWEQAEHQMLDSINFQSVKPLGSIELPAFLTTVNSETTILATTTKSNSLREKFLELIGSAKKTLVVASYGWDADHKIVNALCMQAKKGVDITVLARKRPVSMPALVKMANAGIKVLGYRWLHAKVILVDEQQCIVMSANIQQNGMDTGFETGIWLTDNRIRGVNTILDNWINNCESELEINATLKNMNGNIEVLDNCKLIPYKVSPFYLKKLEALEAGSVEEITDSRDIPKIDWREAKAHKVRFEWGVKVPLLQRHAKEIFQNWEEIKNDTKITPIPFNPPIFKMDGKKLVAISSENELGLAIEQKAKHRCDAIVMRG